MLVTITERWKYRTAGGTTIYQPGDYVLTDEIAAKAEADGVTKKGPVNGKRSGKGSAASVADTPEGE